LTANGVLIVFNAVCVPLWCYAIGWTSELFKPARPLQCHINYIHPSCRWTDSCCSLSGWV